MRVAIVGGYNQGTYEKLLKKMGNVEFQFHNGKPRHNNKRALENMIKDADCVIIVQSACSHMSMWDAKDAAKKCNKTVYYAKGIGLSSVLNTIEGKAGSLVS